MPQSDDYAWLPLPLLLAQLGLPEDGPKSNAVDVVRLAAADEVEALRPDLPWAEPGYLPPPRIVQGACMWAARLWARRGSPSGLVSFGEFGVVNTPSFDADAERLLGIGRYAKPAIG